MKTDREALLKSMELPAKKPNAKCDTCLIIGHDQCPLFPDCPCCENTIDRMNQEAK